MFHTPIAMIFGLVNVVQAQSLARDAMKYLGTLIAAHGFVVDGVLWEAIVGVVVAGIGSLWSLYAARQKSIVATAATIVPIPEVSQRAAGVADPVPPASVAATVATKV